MYPRVSDLFRDLLGFELPIPIYSFGLMVAVAILVGAAIVKREMDRMHAAGQLPGVRLKVRDGKGRERFETASPSALVWTIMLIAAVAGIAGSKLFYFFEQWPTFVQDPLGVALSPAGLTFYGGLICGSLAIAYYVRRKGLPVAYVPFEGEQHGFRKAENIIRSLEAELYFYGAVFGFTPADPLEPVAIDNLPG